MIKEPQIPDTALACAASPQFLCSLDYIPLAAEMADIQEKPVETTHPEVAGKTNGFQSKKEALHEFRENEGYIVDTESGDGVKLAKDGHTRLIPQPSDDPRDPLNWSWSKKHLMLIIVSLTAFLPDYGSATGAVTLIPQAAQVSPHAGRHSGSFPTWVCDDD